MHTALHAVTWGLQRLGILVAVLVLVPVLAYVLLVVAIVVGQSVAAFGQ